MSAFCRAALKACVSASLFVLVAVALSQTGEQKPSLEVKPKDHISVIGNTLADRMQHDGWLETFFYSRFPKHDLIFRNLGYAADEIKTRLRSANFGTPDQWLTKMNTDVILAFFGYNESFAGEKGLPQFKEDLDNFVKKTLSQKYNGQSPPRLVLFSPVAHENLHDPNLPDGTANNKRLELYTAAMAEVARANSVPFVDLFHTTKELYAKSKRPLTINGVHLNEYGNELVAQAIDRALFPIGPEPKRDTEQTEKLRQAVLDKNFVWFNRYRIVDGYSVYGERSKLRFVGGQTNKDVMDREFEILDAMTANRDKRIWSVAQGGDMKVDDNNTPPFMPVITNKPGPLEGKKHIFLDPEEAIKKLTVAKGMKVNLFASEKDWPELANPVQMAWDTKGRLWVAVWPTYPHWTPKMPMNDKLIILEDTKGTGRADKMTVFADNLHCPTGFEFWNGGILLEQGPDLIFLKDTTGSGKADYRVRILQGMDTADTHHTANSFVLDPGGALYFQEGTFHHTQVETPWGPPVRNANAGVYRFEPRTGKLDAYISFGFANPHGHVIDRWGQDIVVDGTGANPYHGTLFSGQVDYPQRHSKPPQVYSPKTRPCAGTELLVSSHFPPENQGNLLVANVIGFQGILQYKIRDKGASIQGIETDPIVSSKDPNFRPSDIRIGPDGAIYFLDWHNPIIGHMQHNLRDPNRDTEHGRIYRVTYEGRPLLKPTKINGEPVVKLLESLKSPEDRVRYWTRIELSGRPSAEVIAAAQKWLDTLDPNDPEIEHHRMEALWLHQSHNIVNEALLARMLRSPDFHARAAATRVLCYWRDRVNDPLGLLHVQVTDSHPRVRLEAIRALSFFSEPRALDVALELLTRPDDTYLAYTFNETLNTLERRLGAGKGTIVNRNNIAVSLLKMLDKDGVQPERKPALIESITRYGSGKELQVIWERAAAGAYPPPLRKLVMGWLAEAADIRRVQPKVEEEAIRKLLAETSKDTGSQAEAIRLAAAWKITGAADELRRIAQNANAPGETRFAAIDALAVLSSKESSKALSDLAGAGQAVPVRFRAAVALAKVDTKQGAAAAAKALAAASEKDDTNYIVEAFLVRKDGSDELAAALAGEKLSVDCAKRILRAMLLAGRNDTALANVASKFAGLDAAVKLPTSQEISRIASEVQAKGDAARGERIFHRADLGCLKCHSVGKAGGNIGPDLGPVGAASPLEYIVQSVLDPSASIKEEYLTKVIATSSGLLITGIPIERNKNELIVKDATGKHIKIATADIESEAAGKSLMPEGITRFLTHAEQLDLIRFVSDLGKPGPFQLRTASTIQRWKKLKSVSSPLRDDLPNREVIREQVLAAPSEAWESHYSLVSGKLPLDELQKSGEQVAYLQGEVQVHQGGPVDVLIQSSGPTSFWIDEDAFEKQSKATVNLTPGRHRITVRVALNNDPAATLSLELRKAASSKASFEIVHGE